MAPKLIHDVVTNAKIIIMLRDPVQRSFLHYMLRRGSGSETSSFRDAIKKALNSNDDYSRRIVEAGFYSQQVKRYIETFGKDNVKIVIFEEFVKDVRKYVKEILEFLDVTEEPPKSIKKVHNPFKVPRGAFSTFALGNATMRNIGKNLVPYKIRYFVIEKILQKKGNAKSTLSQHDGRFMEDIYRKDVKQLQELLGRTLPWPLATNQN